MPEFQEKQKILFCGKQKPENYYHNNKKTTQIFCKLRKTAAFFACQSTEL